MSDLQASLDRVAEAGVAGITLLPLREPRSNRRARVRRFVPAVAALAVVFGAVAIAFVVRSPQHQGTSTLGQAQLRADASYVVPSDGMSPTLRTGDVVASATEFGTIARGDVVRVRLPASTNVPAPPGGDAGFKRVVGMPGESIEGRNGHVLVDGQQLDEPYISATTGDFARVVVPIGSYFLLGDNRASSKDSRQWGPVRRSDILAIALRITAPRSRAGPLAGSTP